MCLSGLWGSLLLTACSHTLTIRSEPAGATLFVVDAQGNRGALVGTTPLTLKPDTGQAHATYELRKNGFEATTLVVPLIEASRVEIGVRLKAIDDAYFRERFQTDQSRILSRQFIELLKLQNAILQRSDAEVERLAQSMKGNFEQVSAWHSLLGNFYFLKGQRDRAKSYYQKALELDPQNNEARTLLQALSKKGES